MIRTVASLASFVLAASVAVTPLGAQIVQTAQSRGPDRVPPGHRPPAGMCRVWIDGVPPGRQPAPTSCARAERERYSYGRGARVVYGERGVLRGVDGSTDRRGDWRDDWRNDRREDGRRGVRERRYLDASGRVCTEKTQYKKNGDRKYTVECKARHGSHDGRERQDWYPSTSATSATLPSMIDAVIFSRGRTSGDVTRWLGSGPHRVRFTDVNADGRPEQATWLNTSGRIVQQWIDGNRDGRADVVRVYKSGKLVRVIGDE